jgi:hypothetical protein
LTLSRPGYDPLTFPIDLIAGKTTEVERSLTGTPKYGTVQLRMKSGWGDVYLDGKKIARAPTSSLKLPVGRISLQFVNDGDKTKPPVKWTETCDVTEQGPNVCVTKLP